MSSWHHRRTLVQVACLAGALIARPALGVTLPEGFVETLVTTAGVTAPTAMQIAPDGRLFVCEQGGSLRVIKNGLLLFTPFVTLTVSSVGERGLLGVALDPAFATNQFVYVYYTATTPTIHNRISRFTANGDVAVPGSEFVLLDLPDLGSTSHNGGALNFGPDGKLYAAVGENAVPSNAQSLNTVLGKMLRLNRDGTIPADNPFFGSTVGQNRAIWALGLRNPFTFGIERDSGRMFINDVGQNTFEEINEGIRGANYGWPDTEGPTTNPNFTTPRHWYSHPEGCAISGGAFYAPLVNRFPADYSHDYFFADYCGGWIKRFDPASNTVELFATGLYQPVDLKVSDDGVLYYLSHGGTVYRVEYGIAVDVVRDTFNGAPGTPITAHAPEVNVSGNPWMVTGSSPIPTLGPSGVGVTPGSGHLQATIDTGVSDVLLSVDYRVGSGPGMGGLVLRLTDADNFLLVETYLDQLQLYRRGNGLWILESSRPLPAPLIPGSVHRLQAHARGCTITAWWDGVPYLQEIDCFRENATRHGVNWNSAYDPTTVYANLRLASFGPLPGPPAIVDQPQSRTIASGSTGLLVVNATGTLPLSYQWYLGPSGETTTPIAGATAASYTTPPLTAAASYWVRVTNGFGSADSGTAAITVAAPPTIAAEPQSQTIASGQTVTLSVTSNGTPPIGYQWYEGPSGTTKTPIAGATATTFSTRMLVSTHSYWVRVTNAFGTVDSNTATITVTPPLGLLVQDSFGGPVGTPLTTHAPDVNVTGSGWTLNGGAPMPMLTPGGVGVTSGTGHLQVTLDAGVTDIVMGVDYRVGSGPGMGALVFRLTDADRFLLLETYLNGLHVYRRQSGMWILLASAPLPAPLVAGAVHRLEVRTQGPMIEGWWDGTRLLQTADLVQVTATRHGLDWNSAFDSTSIYDEFQLSLNGSAPSSPDTPASPLPVSGATGVGTTVVPTWTANGATSYDVSFGTSNPPPQAIAGLTMPSYRPLMTTATTYFWQITAHNATGTTVGPVWSFRTRSSTTPADLLVLDVFSGVAGTPLTAHQPDVSVTGSTWTMTGATPTPSLVAGGVGVAAGSGHLQATIDTGSPNIAMAVDYYVGSGPGMGGLVFRMGDPDNFLLLETYLDALWIFKRESGSWVPLAFRALPSPLVAGSMHRLEIRALNSVIEGWWDGMQLLQITDSFQATATRHGLNWNSAYDATSTYGNLQIVK
jgi:glucose/arabinose dehydrogenase